MREMEKLLEKVCFDDVPPRDQTSVLEESSDSSTVKAEPQEQCTTDQASLVTFSRQKLALLQCEYALADPRGGGARDARPPGGPNSFIFMQFSAKI